MVRTRRTRASAGLKGPRPDLTISFMAIWVDEVRILIFDDPAEQETSQRSQFSSTQLNSTTAVNLVLNLVLQSSRGACIDFSPELGMQADNPLLILLFSKGG